MLRYFVLSAVLLLAIPACQRSLRQAQSPDAGIGVEVDTHQPQSTVMPLMRFGDPGAGFYDTPFPGEHRLLEDGTTSFAGFPNPDGVEYVEQLIVLAKQLRGFGLSSGIFFRLSGKPDLKRLPDVNSSVERDSAVFLIGVDKSSPDYLKRYPVRVAFLDDSGPFGATDMLSLIPLQGLPLRARTLYAAVVMRRLNDGSGLLLAVSKQMQTLLDGGRPEGLNEAANKHYRDALAALQADGVETKQIAGMTAFVTQDPHKEMLKIRNEVFEKPAPVPEAPFKRIAIYEGFCVYQTTIKMPQYQHGKLPYLAGGGGWKFDQQGNPVRFGEETANLFVTVPRLAMPPNGFPAVLFVRTGQGGVVPLADRGVHTSNGGVNTPGTGPGSEFAKVGYLGVQVDGPHTGLRNISKQDEQFLIFNILNPEALRDNVRQSALELALFGRVLSTLRVDGSDCPGVTTGGGQVKIDTKTVGIFGHSTGSLVAQIASALQPIYRAVILSGAGSSYIENLIYKRKPLNVKPLAEAVLEYRTRGHQLTIYDPVLSLVQWLGESSDPQVYGRHLITEPLFGPPRHVLMLQGVVDNYNLPPMANTTALSVGLDLGGEMRDLGHPKLTEFAPLADWFGVGELKNLALPTGGNRVIDGRKVTALVTQHLEDSVEDGHEVVFQAEQPKFQYRCFLKTLLSDDLPQIPPTSGTVDCPAP